MEPTRTQKIVNYIKERISLRTQNNIVVDNVEKDKKQICIMENLNRIRNIKNRVMNEQNQRWSAFKKAPGTQTSEKNSADKKGDKVAEAQSLKEEVAPNGSIRTRVPFGLKKQEAPRWLARRAMGITESRLAQELREFQKQRNQHEMLVPVELMSPDTGKTRRIKVLLDNGCTTTCIDWAYTDRKSVV